MLRIKKEVDLKELEKFGYFDYGESYMKVGINNARYFINKNTREITRLHPYSLREIPTENEMSDLITAGYVETKNLIKLNDIKVNFEEEK